MDGAGGDPSHRAKGARNQWRGGGEGGTPTRPPQVPTQPLQVETGDEGRGDPTEHPMGGRREWAKSGSGMDRGMEGEAGGVVHVPRSNGAAMRRTRRVCDGMDGRG
eukprot:scaffold100_cov323-Pavlova_lutheri.AAC.36